MLLERIEEDLRQALREHDAGRVNVLRVLRAAIQNAAIAARTSAVKSLDDAAVEAVVRQEAKKLRDALVDFTRAARQDLIAATEAELTVLSSYLPSGLTSDELRAIVQDVVERLRRDGVVQFGRAMGAVVREVRGRADGESVATAVRAALQEPVSDR